MVAYLKRMPAGIPGAPTRNEHSTIEPQVITPAGSAGVSLTSYGQAGQIDATTGQFRMIAAADTDAYGVLVRPYPTQNVNSTDGLGVATPPAQGPCNVLVRGYMMVKLSGAAAAKKGGTVYVWYSASAGAHVQGNFEAAASGGNTLALPDKWYFTGPADAAGNVEIAVNI